MRVLAISRLPRGAELGLYALLTISALFAFARIAWLKPALAGPIILAISAGIAFVSFFYTRATQKKRVAYDHLFQIVTNENFLKCEEAFILASRAQENDDEAQRAKVFLSGNVREWPLSFAALELRNVEELFKNNKPPMDEKNVQEIFQTWRMWCKNVIAYVNQCELLCVSIAYDIIDENVAKAHFGSELIDRFDAAMKFIGPIRQQGDSDGEYDGEYYVYFQTVAENWRKDRKVNSLPKPPIKPMEIWQQIIGVPQEYRKLPDKLRRMRKERGAGAESADA